MELYECSAHQLHELYRKGEASPVEILELHEERIRRWDPDLGCYLHLLEDDALAMARASEKRYREGTALGPFDGVPVAVKDNMCVRGHRATAGSRILENYVATYDAHVVERLAAAGAVIIGKTNLDEFAMGSSNENSAFGPVHNPWDLDTVPGGSSGGSAAAVSAGEVVWALGTDTGGSVRQPAALTGVVGLKPTYGRISRYGLIAFASSLDTVGTFTRSVRDAAVMLTAIAGRDHRDATSLADEPGDYLAGIDRGVQGLRVGVIRDAFGEGVQPDVAASVRAAVDRLAALGAEVSEVDLPHAEYALSAYYLIAPSEASSNLARYDGVRYGLREEGDDSIAMMFATRGAGFGPEVKRRIMLGTYALSAGYYEAYYGQAQKVRTLIIQDYAAAFAGVDVLVSPTSPTTAFRIGEKADDPMAMYLNDIFTIPANLAGVPAISVPCGLDAGGLPIGLQITAPALDEATLFRAASALESDLGLDLRPPLLAGV